MSILKGTIFITDNPEVIYSLPLDPGSNTKVVNMDEDGILMDNSSIITGTCLLPPVQAMIAEADGNEQLYDTIYTNHLLEPYQQEFISALLSYLYKGGNIVIFLPELGYNNTMNKFIQIMFDRYGIHIGIIGNQNPAIANCYYDERCIPIWLNMIYSVRVISAYEFLYIYPEDAPINNRVINDLINEINPYGKSINDRINYIIHLHKVIHQNPKVRSPIGNIRRNY